MIQVTSHLVAEKLMVGVNQEALGYPRHLFRTSRHNMIFEIPSLLGLAYGIGWDILELLKWHMTFAKNRFKP